MVKDKTEAEWSRFERVFEWVFALANREVMENDGIKPTVLCVSVRAGKVSRSAVVNLYSDGEHGDELLELIDRLVELRNVDVAVHMREGEDDAGASVVIMQLVSKRFEVTVANPLDKQRRTLGRGRLSRELMAQRAPTRAKQ